MNRRYSITLAFAVGLTAGIAAAGDPCPIVPQPKIYHDAGRDVAFRPAAIVVGAHASQPERYSAERLAGHIERRFGHRPPVCVEGQEPAGQLIVLGCRNAHAALNRICRENQIALTPSSPGEDGFVIEFVGSAEQPTMVIGGSNPRGAIYGADALFDLTERGPQGDRVRMAAVRDWPSIAWRGRPHSVLLHHLVPGAMDAYVRARINFTDVRDDPRVKATIVMPPRKASMGFPPGVPFDTANIRRVIDAAHQRGMFVYGTVSCSFPIEKLPEILRTFQELIALGVDGLWLSFDDTGAGESAPAIIRAVLDLGRQHGMTGRKIAVTPPLEAYVAIDERFNREMAKIPGFAEVQWMFTRVPCQADADMAARIGLKRLPGWWHNLVNFGGGFLHNGEIICTLRADGRPAYVDLQPISMGWHRPNYERIRTAAMWTDTVLLWGVCNGFPEEYTVGSLGLWAWNPEAHEWPTVRDSIYRYVYGAGQVDTIRQFDDELERLKALFETPAWRFEPNLGWPTRLKRPADRAQALSILDQLEPLAAKVRQAAPRETAIDPARLERVYLEPMAATLAYARKMTLLDFPEQWIKPTEQDILRRLDAGDEAGALKALEAVQGKVQSQVARVQSELAALKGVAGYAAFWQQRLASLGPWKQLAAERKRKAKPAARPQAACPITPQPKVFRPSDRACALAGATIVVGAKASLPERYAAEQLQTHIERRFHQRLPIVAEDKTPPAGPVVLLGQRTSSASVDRLCREHKIDLGPQSPGEDGFVIETLNDGPRPVILAGGSNAPGVIYAQNAVFDLLRRGPNGLEMAAASVRDWPSIRWRGRTHWRMCVHQRPGAMDSYARYRMNFTDLRDSEASDGYAPMGFPPGFAIRQPVTGQVLEEAHRRGMFVYGVVSCAVKAAKYDGVLNTFQDLIALGVDGIWLSFDDTGNGEKDAEVIGRVLDLGRQHGFTGRRVGYTPPVGSYNVVNTPTNRSMVTIPGLAEIQWFFTTVPSAENTRAVRSLGVKLLPAWWHNLFNIEGGFLHNGAAIQSMRLDGRPAYLDMQTLAMGWGKPQYDKLRDAAQHTDTVLLWSLYDGWPEDYEVGAMGIWAWNPAAHDWTRTRQAVYRDVYGPALVATAGEFDDRMAELKSLFAMPVRGFAPNKGWPPRLKNVADRTKALTLLDQLDALAARLQSARSESILEPMHLESTYLEPMRATLQYARKMTVLDYPEYTLDKALSGKIADLCRTGRNAEAERLLAEARPTVERQLAAIQRDLAGLRGISTYVDFWRVRMRSPKAWTAAKKN
jgi:hypothetical protein